LGKKGGSLMAKLYRTRDCDCTAQMWPGQKRPGRCEEHGNRFQTEAELNPPQCSSLRPVSPKRQADEDAGTRPRRHGSTLNQRQPDRDWTAARAKVEEEGCCRICKRTDRKLDAAHVLGREHDEPKVSRSTGEILKELYVDPDRIFPACGPFPDNCHGDVDFNRINYLQVLTLPEQIKAVEDAGGIEAARIRLAPVENREEVERSAVAT
jgi:hypothetical protein